MSCSPSLTASPADSWPRCWSAKRPSAAIAAASARPPPAGRPRRRRTSQRSPAATSPPSSPERPGEPVLPGVAQVGERRRRAASATREPRSSAAPVAPWPGELDDEPVAADRRRAARPAGRAGGRGGRGRARAAGRHVTTIRDGLSPNSSTAGRPADRQPERAPAAVPRPDGASASATARPPPETSWAEATRPRADRLADERLERRLAGQVERRRAVLRGEPGEGRVRAAGEARRRSPDEDDRVAGGDEGRADPERRRRRGARRPRSPASGAIAPVGDSL